MDHHTVAAISITGTSLDVLGSLYLAYDLLGGQHGPLRVLTRAVTIRSSSESATASDWEFSNIVTPTNAVEVEAWSRRSSRLPES
jgi:hypothetical protein